MSETIKYRNQHILLLVVSFCVSAFVLSFLFEASTAKTQSEASQLKVSPDLLNVQYISTEIVKDKQGNPLGDAFIYSYGGNLYVTLTAAEEKQIETTSVRLTNQQLLSENSDLNTHSLDYSSNERQPQKIKEVVIPIDAIQENTHLISAVQTTSEKNGSQRKTGSVVFHPQLIQAIIH
ncbi:MAG: hypothetical protein ACO2Z9_02765 [Crocinitomicaceae bacterium]